MTVVTVTLTFVLPALKKPELASVDPAPVDAPESR
jgi:hypothetical protein